MKFNTSSSAHTMQNDSHVISKFKPKVRITHILSPEIIKTDAADFRELVQRLTGKPKGRKSSKEKTNTEMITANDTFESNCCKLSEAAAGLCNGCPSSGSEERIKEEEAWGEENSSFFGGFGDLEGFMQGLSEFPLVPLNSSLIGERRETSFLV